MKVVESTDLVRRHMAKVGNFDFDSFRDRVLASTDNLCTAEYSSTLSH